MRSTSPDAPQMTKRKVLALLSTLPFAVPRAAGNDNSDAALKRKFRGVAGVVIVLNVAKGAAEKKFVSFITDTGRRIAAPASMVHGGRGNLGFMGGVLPVPKAVLVVWREGKPEHDSYQGWAGGTIAGDYKVEVASRIPDDVLDYVRAARGRALRLKFRLKDDGVLFAWDVEESFTSQYGDGLRYKLPGGDFLDTQY